MQQHPEPNDPIANPSWPRVIAEAILIWITFAALAVLLWALP